jgi:adenylate cyclase
VAQADPSNMQDRLDDLESSNAHPDVVERLRQLLLEGSDFDCYKINAFRLAEELGLAPAEALRALLFATRIGLFDLNFDIHCPSCEGLPEYHRHLMGLQNRAHCQLCRVDWELSFDDQVEVTFTVNPEVRTIDYQDWADRDQEGKFAWWSDVLEREGRMPDALQGIAPGATEVIDLNLQAHKRYTYHMPTRLERAGLIRVEGQPTSEVSEAALRADDDGRFSAAELVLPPGPARLSVHYDTTVPCGFILAPVEAKKNWVSAAFLTTQQDFRDLFEGEFLAPDASFAIRSLTLMFTDIKDSTAMYEDLGDGRAYAVVQDHFRVINELIRRDGGGVVKTIGDAVMAAFPRAADGVRAACDIQQALACSDGPASDVVVKVGLHRGPTIAVTSNRSVDYFGRTVNIAARVQGAAGAGEVLMTRALHDDPAVAAELEARGLQIERQMAEFKGIAEAAEVFVISPRS